jgi:uncharacterized membrane protein
MKKYFLTGLVTLLPLAVTIAFVVYLVNLLTNPFLGIVTSLLISLPISFELIQTISQILTLAAIFFFILGIGLVAQRFFFTSLMKLADRIASRIPFLGSVYKTIKDIFQTLFSEKKSFQQVVMLTFPRQGSYAIGLVSGESPKECISAAKEELISVFVPTTPNPLTGFLVLRHREELIHLDMTAEEAIKYIVSAGVVPPESIPEET